MTSRFLALAIHNHAAARDTISKIENSIDILKVYDSDNLVVFSDREVVSLAFCGVVIGSLFSKDGAFDRITRFAPAERDLVQRSAGKHLIDKYWGGYVAFIEGRELGDVTGLRDPSGAIQCYYADSAHLTVIASDAKTLFSVGLHTPQIDWDYVNVNVQNSIYMSSRTAFTGLHELLPGFSAIFSPASRAGAIWSPWDHASVERNVEDVRLAEEIRSVVLKCTRSLSSEYKKVSLGVSGGLDSSIVAASLASQNVDFLCYTMMTSEPKGDERYYAKMLTDSLEMALRECPYELRSIDVRRSSAAYLPRPLSAYVAQAIDQEKLVIQQEFGVDAHFSGGGGDNVFCLLHSAAPIVDRFSAEGVGPGLWKSVEEISAITSASALEIIKLSIAHAFWKKQFRPKPAMNKFVPFDVEGFDQELYSHPWLNAPADIPPGKARHVGMLALTSHGTNGDPTKSLPPVVQPLLSQPLVEFCLSIPSWKWSAGGANRALARTAFADMLPTEILARTSKGGPGTFVDDIFMSNRGVLREFLLDGNTVKNLPVEVKALESALKPDYPISRIEIQQVLGLASVEAWSRAWQ